VGQLWVDNSPLAYVSGGKRGTKNMSILGRMNVSDVAKAKFGRDFEKLTADQQRDVEVIVNERRGMARMGVVATILGSIAAASGQTTWAPPEDEEARKLFYKAGRRAYSINIGGKDVPFMLLGPWALALAIPAAFADSLKNNPEQAGDEWYEQIGSAALGAIGFLSNANTPLAGMGTVFEALSGKQDYTIGKWAGWTGTQFLPASGFIRYVNKWVDPYLRKPKGAFEIMKSDWPIISQELNPIVDPDGNPVERTMSNRLMPYDLGARDDAKAEGALQGRLATIRERRINDSMVDGLLSEKQLDDLRLYVYSQSREERQRLVSRVRRNAPDVAKQIFPPSQSTGMSLDLDMNLSL